MKITLTVPAKINLFLDVTAARADGYHTLETVMQSVGLYDTLTLTTEKGTGKTVLTMPGFDVPNEKNTAYRAVLLFRDTFEGVCTREEASLPIGQTDITVHIEKHIPAGTGLGGASADAAGVLLALSRLFKTDFSEEAFISLGAKIGADVPFCMHRGTVFATGIGEKMRDIAPLPDCSVLIAKPLGETVSTPFAYSEIDRLSLCSGGGKAAAFLEAMAAGDFAKMRESAENPFELVLPRGSRVSSLKDILYGEGALFAGMTGSGPALFALFKTEAERENAAAALRGKAELYPCRTVR